MTTLIQQITTTLDCSPEEATEIIEAAAPLWRALEPRTDGYGGAEFERIFPEAIELIYRLANPAAAAARDAKLAGASPDEIRAAAIAAL
jgi:hypothetical protein